MLESVHPLVEAAIYCYFVLVAAIGCYLHGRLRFGARTRSRDDRTDDGSALES